jgi:hypothetical protein
MSELVRNETLPTNGDREAPPSNPQDQLGILRKLAAAAHLALEQTDAELQAAGFSTDPDYYKTVEDHVERVRHLEAGGVTYHTTIGVPHAYLEVGNQTEQEQIQLLWKRGYEQAKFNSEFGSIRFACGQLWYTLRSPWSNDRFAKARAELGLTSDTSCEQVERHLHYRFQQLYQKPTDDWTQAEAAEWTILNSYIDLEAYRHDNPPTDNRIGCLISADENRVAIDWKSAGVLSYDSRLVPAALLTTPQGWLVHAVLQKRNGAEVWLSVWTEPPLPSSDAVIAEDLAAAENSKSGTLQAADWPKIEN